MYIFIYFLKKKLEEIEKNGARTLRMAAYQGWDGIVRECLLWHAHHKTIQNDEQLQLLSIEMEAENGKDKKKEEKEEEKKDAEIELVEQESMRRKRTHPEDQKEELELQPQKSFERDPENNSRIIIITNERGEQFDYIDINAQSKEKENEVWRLINEYNFFFFFFLQTLTKKNGFTALHHAVSRMLIDEEMVRLLVISGLDCNIVDENQRTALSYLCESGGHFGTTTVLVLLQVGGKNLNINTPDEVLHHLFFVCLFVCLFGRMIHCY
ncbi:hypothetical protein RFI_03809, partial [Reticulomyxa filosa]